MQKILLATDLDRTVIPNGNELESPAARPLFRTLVARPEVTLAYVSGRNRDLQQDAIKEYELPLPDFAIGDVGTTIYEVGAKATWRPLEAWSAEIAPAWRGQTWAGIKALFDEVPGIRLQDDSPAYQNTYKVSYYTDVTIDEQALIDTLQRIAGRAGIDASFIWSIDEQRHVGLLDILPKSATKIHAVQFLRQRLGLAEEETVFCGDSGNDLPALTSGLNAVAVKNAHPDVKRQAQVALEKKGLASRLYLARGNFLNMNGNYSAGVIEGVAHFFPEVISWLEVKNKPHRNRGQTHTD
jgi:sucrose-6-phosphatase